MMTRQESIGDAAVLLVSYSQEARSRLEAVLLEMGLRAHGVDGRAQDAGEQVKRFPAPIVVIDHGAQDVSVTQAVRQIGQLLPASLVIAAYSADQAVDLYRAGHRIGWEESLEVALQKHGARRARA